MTDVIKQITEEVLSGVPRIPGEAELLQHIQVRWGHGGTIDQIICSIDPCYKWEVSVPQLLEILIAHGEVKVTESGLYYSTERLDQISLGSSRD